MFLEKQLIVWKIRESEEGNITQLNLNIMGHFKPPAKTPSPYDITKGYLCDPADYCFLNKDTVILKVGFLSWSSPAGWRHWIFCYRAYWQSDFLHYILRPLNSIWGEKQSGSCKRKFDCVKEKVILPTPPALLPLNVQCNAGVKNKAVEWAAGQPWRIQ